MPSQEQIDAEYENAELKRRVDQLETLVNGLMEAGLDRLIESGLLQFDGIPIRWDSKGMQVETPNGVEIPAIYFVAKLVADPTATTLQRGYLSGNITASSQSDVFLRSYYDATTVSALRLRTEPDSASAEISVKVIDGWFGISTAISPSQITANQNDYAPTNFQSAGVLRLSSDASRDITGILGDMDGRILLVFNVGSNPIVLKNESASSTAANRFALGGSDLTLNSGESTPLWYDSTSSRWRPF